jgi:hypothetical protein
MKCCVKELVLLLAAFCILYLAALPIDTKCDMTVAAIDYTIGRGSDMKDMMDGKMNLTSYLRQNIARHMKNFYDHTECT